MIKTLLNLNYKLVKKQINPLNHFRALHQQIWLTEINDIESDVKPKTLNSKNCVKVTKKTDFSLISTIKEPIPIIKLIKINSKYGKIKLYLEYMINSNSIFEIKKITQ
jgi:hypothetical protein